MDLKFYPHDYVTTTRDQRDSRRYHEGELVLPRGATGIVIGAEPEGQAGLDHTHYFVEFAALDFVLLIPEEELKRADFVGAYIYPRHGRLFLRLGNGYPTPGWTAEVVQAVLRTLSAKQFWPIGVWMQYWG